jgi:hypothetical protein
VIGGSGNAGHSWTAFPPPGPFPYEVFSVLPFGDTLDVTGWTIQSDSLDLSAAQVTITSDGNTMPTMVHVLLPNYGSSSAISILPQGWTAQPDTSYHVSVAGVGEAIEYDVFIVDC